MQEAVALVLQRRVELLRSMLTASSLQASHGGGSKTAVTDAAHVEQKVTEDALSATAAGATVAPAAIAEISPSGGSPTVTDSQRAPDSVQDAASDAGEVAWDPDSEAAAVEAENRRLRRALRRMREDLHVLSDQADQARSELARAKRHMDLHIGAELQKMNSQVAGFQNGQVLYKSQRAETAKERHFRIFGTHDDVGPGPYNGSWIEWGKPFRYPTHAEVRAYRLLRDQRDKAARDAEERARLAATERLREQPAAKGRTHESLYEIGEESQRKIKAAMARAEAAGRPIEKLTFKVLCDIAQDKLWPAAAGERYQNSAPML